jgi:hypothetical protein
MTRSSYVRLSDVFTVPSPACRSCLAMRLLIRILEALAAAVLGVLAAGGAYAEATRVPGQP